jgi:membrane-bound lytic murein transglycosylase D
MEPSSVRTLFTALLVAFFFFQTKADNTYNIEEIKPRFEAMECIVKPRYTSVVEGYIKKYLSSDGSLAKRIMGRAAIYFPVFDKYLKEHDMPQDLKYLSILESALNPKAVSPVGATGLWQFMAETGRSFGLSINKEVDERSCPYNATDAAMKYLSRHYERFGSWELALAAYNCGAGNITNAIKRARTQDYWKLSQFLPRETRNFVPAFLGAAYMANYYHLHNIEPEYPSLDLQLTETVKVFDQLNFETIAAVTRLPLDIITTLNPAFKKNFIPENPNGHQVILPRRTSAALLEYLDLRRPDRVPGVDMPVLPSIIDSADYTPDKYYFRSVYTVAEGDDIHELANIFNCSAYNLKVWNKLTSYHLVKGQELDVWFPNETHHFLKQEEKIEVQPKSEPVQPASTTKDALIVPKKIPDAKPKIVPVEEVKNTAPAVRENPAGSSKKTLREQDGNIIFYQLNRNESLFDVATRHPGVTVQQLLEWNGFTKDNLPMPGFKLKIRQL